MRKPALLPAKDDVAGDAVTCSVALCNTYSMCAEVVGRAVHGQSSRTGKAGNVQQPRREQVASQVPVSQSQEWRVAGVCVLPSNFGGAKDRIFSTSLAAACTTSSLYK